MPPRARKKQTAKPHDARHENGLAQPVKKIDLNSRRTGQQPSDGGPRPPVRPPLWQPGAHDGSAGSSEGSGAEGTSAVKAEERDSEVRGKGLGTASPAEEDDSDDHQHTTVTHAAQPESPSHRQINVDSKSTPTSPEFAAFHLAFTILKACPLADTIAILIILLQIPPTLLSLIQFLFAILTFVPASTSSTSLNSLFQSSAGAPTLATIIIADLAILAVWIFLWSPAQRFALDLAQIVIAISVGTGYSGTVGGTKGALLCLGVVVVSHAARRKDLRPSRPAFLSSLGPLTPAEPPLSSSTREYDDSSPRSYRGWVRSLVAVHILTQGIVGFVRRRLSKRSVDSKTPSTKRSDPETASEPQVHSNDRSASNTPVPSAEPRDKSAHAKRRRKTLMSTRTQQPLWNSLANIKVIASKEYEHSYMAPATSSPKQRSGVNRSNAPFNKGDESIWVTRMGATEMRFGTNTIRCPRHQEKDGAIAPRGHALDGSGAVSSNNLYVRLNGNDWTSTRMLSAQADQNNISNEASGDWIIEVFGLAPLTSYMFEILRAADDFVMFTAIMTTLPQSTKTIAPPTLPKATGPGTRHSSSAAETLRESIAVAEAKVQEDRAHSKRIRRDHRSQISTLKKDVEALNARVASAGHADERQRQRILQISQNIRQAEDATASLVKESENLGSVPSEHSRQWTKKKEKWEENQRLHKEASDALVEEKIKIDSRQSATQAELTAVQQKRERLEARHARLDEQRERIVAASAQGLTEKERRAAEFKAREQEHHAAEKKFIEQIKGVNQSLKETQAKSQQLWQQIHAIETASRDQLQQQQQAQMMQPQTLAPDSEAHILPGLPPPLASTAGIPPSRYGGFPTAPQPNTMSTAFPQLAGSQMSSDSRARSASMLSMFGSSWPDVPDASSVPPVPSVPLLHDQPPSKINTQLDREPSVGSGSGSGSGSLSGSQRDPASPVVKTPHSSTTITAGPKIWN